MDSDFDFYCTLRCTITNNCGIITFKDYRFYTNNPICGPIGVESKIAKSLDFQITTPSLSIFPNPSNGNFQIKLVTKESNSYIKKVLISTKMGAPIFTKEFANNEKIKTISFVNKPNNIYIVRVFDGKEWFTQEINILK